MDTIFFWLIAGASIVLLGVFLIASERELKTKRRELEELKNKPSAEPVPDNTNVLGPVSLLDHERSTDLAARNDALAQEVSSLSKQLEAGESNLEQIKTLRAHLNSTEAENAELQAERDRLRSEISTLTAKMELDPSHPGNAVSDMHNEAKIAELQAQLEASQAKIRDLENTREHPADTESQQTAFEELQKSLEVSTLQLQNALAAEQEKQKALETVQMQLSGMEQSYQELNETNLRFREENSQLLQRLALNEQHAERSLVLRQRLQDLQSKHTEIIEQDRLIQEEIAAMTHFLDVSYPHGPATIHDDQTYQVPPNEAITTHYDGDVDETTSLEGTPLELDPSDNKEDEGNKSSPPSIHHNSVNLTPAIAVGTPATRDYPAAGTVRKKRRFGIFPAAVAIIVVGGALATAFLRDDSEPKHAVNQVLSSVSSKQATSEETNPTSKPSNVEDSDHKSVLPEHSDIAEADKAVRTEPINFHGLPVESKLTKTPGRATTAIASSGRPFPSAWESYEIIQPTRVFSAPREDSQLIANVEPGTRVNVVDSQNGWLEIRSKHGRPPGFIPRAAATRIGQN